MAQIPKYFHDYTREHGDAHISLERYISGLVWRIIGGVASVVAVGTAFLHYASENGL